MTINLRLDRPEDIRAVLETLNSKTLEQLRFYAEVELQERDQTTERLS